jgi:hypothetical protein
MNVAPTLELLRTSLDDPLSAELLHAEPGIVRAIRFMAAGAAACPAW